MSNEGDALSRSRKFTSVKSMEAFQKQAAKRGLIIQEIDRGQPCRVCGDKCPGFELHVWRKTCQHCKCRREEHAIIETPTPLSPIKKSVAPSLDIIEEMTLVEEELPAPPPPVTDETTKDLEEKEEESGSRGDDGVNDDDAGERVSEEGGERYGWTPDGLNDTKLIEKFMACLPTEKRPVLGEEGMHYWLKQIAYQIPTHDSDSTKCHELNDEEKRVQGDYKGQMNDGVHVAKARETGLGDIACYHCSDVIERGSVMVTSSVLDKDLYWHPQCFVCSKCDELLVSFAFFLDDEGSVLCHRHHGEAQFPRCHSCDELIFAGSYTVAEDANWHDKHFCCFECDEPLTSGGKSHLYVRHEGNIFCNECYDEKVARRCSVCQKPITADSRYLMYEEKHMHSACFQCNVCNKSLANQQFYKQDGSLLCKACFETKHGKSCSRCRKSISAGEKSLVMGGQHWHETCFVCGKCEESMVKKPIMEHESGIYCSSCYYDSFGEKCAACKKPLGNEGGARHGDVTYHKRCFCCTNCHTTLAGKQFAVIDDVKNVCIDCYNRAFAKVCKSCGLQIEASLSYVSYSDFHWHETCFKCISCDKSLVGEGFLHREGVVYCSECY